MTRQLTDRPARHRRAALALVTACVTTMAGLSPVYASTSQAAPGDPVVQPWLTDQLAGAGENERLRVSTSARTSRAPAKA